MILTDDWKESFRKAFKSAVPDPDMLESMLGWMDTFMTPKELHFNKEKKPNEL